MIRKGLLWLAMIVACLSAAQAESPADEDSHLVRILRTSNKAQTNQYVCEALEFKNVNPFNIVNFIWAPVSREEGGVYSFYNADEERGYIVVICPEYQLPMLRKIAKQLDCPNLNSAPGSKYIYYRLKHRNVADPGFLDTAYFHLGTSGVLLPDVETNSVLIFDAPTGAAAMERVFKDTLDKPIRQVDLGVQIYEVDVTSDGSLGLDYEAWKNGPGQILGSFRAKGEYFNVAQSRHTHYNNRGSGVYVDYPSAFFDFLVAKGKAKLVTDTSIVSINRTPARFSTGEQILYYSIDADGSSRTVSSSLTDASVSSLSFPTDGDVQSGLNPRSPFGRVSSDGSFGIGAYPQDSRSMSSSVNSADTGVTLDVVPTIGDEMVNLNLDLQVVSLTGYDGSGVPALGSREISDSFAAKVGETVIFGGLTRERKVSTTSKVPLLGSLPVIGYIFGGETESLKKTIVVAAITPTLVENATNVTASDRSLMSQVSGEAVVQLPESEFCFEQGFDNIF